MLLLLIKASFHICFRLWDASSTCTQPNSQSPTFNIRRCQFFGHVHRFRSYSFGHLDLVKWITLNATYNLINIFHKNAIIVTKFWGPSKLQPFVAAVVLRFPLFQGHSEHLYIDRVSYFLTTKTPFSYKHANMDTFVQSRKHPAHISVAVFFHPDKS